MVTAIMTAINYATAPPAPSIDVIADAPPIDPAPMPERRRRAALIDRLPLHLQQGRIAALEADDHYLRVHTTLGSELLLLRLGDAVAEVDGIDGLRCHRSWWVAREAVAAVHRRDGRITLSLSTGIEVPVSRNHVPALRAAGWLS